MMPALGAQLPSWAHDLHRPCWSGKPFPPQPLPLLISLPERRATVQGLATKLSTRINALRWSPFASLSGHHLSFPSFERVPQVGEQLPTARGSSDEPRLMRSEESPETPLVRSTLYLSQRNQFRAPVSRGPLKGSVSLEPSFPDF